MENSLGKLIDFLNDNKLKESDQQIKNIIKDGASGPVLIGQEEISEGLRYHIDNNIPLSEPIYRKFSNAYFELLKEAKQLFKDDKLIVCADSEWILEGDIGEFSKYENYFVPLDFPMAISEENNIIKNAAEYQGKKVQIGKPRTLRKGEPGYGRKQYVVYVKDGDKVKRITFGDADLRAKPGNPKARKSFRARHKCDQKKDKTTPGYWSCRYPPNW